MSADPVKIAKKQVVKISNGLRLRNGTISSGEFTNNSALTDGKTVTTAPDGRNKQIIISESRNQDSQTNTESDITHRTVKLEAGSPLNIVKRISIPNIVVRLDDSSA